MTSLKSGKAAPPLNWALASEHGFLHVSFVLVKSLSCREIEKSWENHKNNVGNLVGHFRHMLGRFYGKFYRNNRLKSSGELFCFILDS